MSNVSKTYQQRLFDDPELKTKSHDDILLWLSESITNYPDVLDEPLGLADVWKVTSVDVERWDYYGASAIERAARAIAPPIPNRPAARVRNVIWEPPIKTERGAIVGFADMYACVDAPQLRLAFDANEHYPALSHDPRWSGIGPLIDASRSRTVAFFSTGEAIGICGGGDKLPLAARELLGHEEPTIADQLRGCAIVSGSVWELSDPRWVQRFSERSVWFEAKTKLPSIGELLRQLQLYRAHGAHRIIVVAPRDAATVKVLRSQGFGFIEAPGRL